ncbi:MAG TPA: hypothetical protein VFV64_12150 [Permianibacter sp.]|nr:hypothetical protein [Permianibacter sp.]
MRFAVLAVALTAALGCSSLALAAQPAPLTLTIADTDWHVSVNGYRWRIPDACLNPRKFGDDQSGRKLGEDDAGRKLGEDAGGRKLGEDDAGRKLGDADAGRKLGEDAGGRKLGDADAGRKLGEDAGGRKLGEDDAGRKLGDADAGRKLGEDAGGRKLGEDDAGRKLGADQLAIRCEYLTDARTPSAVYLWPVAAGTVELNRDNPNLLNLESRGDGALIYVR